MLWEKKISQQFPTFVEMCKGTSWPPQKVNVQSENDWRLMYSTVCQTQEASKNRKLEGTKNTVYSHGANC